MAEPRPPLASLSDAELGRALTALGREIAFPPPPDVASRVRARLDEAPTAPSAPFSRRRAVWLAAAAMLLLILGALALFPDARTAIADRLGLHGVQIRWFEELPTPAPLGSPLHLGRRVTLDEAREAATFPLFVPTSSGFADPAEIYVQGRGRDAMVSFIYPARPDLPAAGVPGVGALLTQFRGDTSRDLVEKGLLGEDAAPETHLEAISVDGERGFWITGAPHGVIFVCHDMGECREETYRLAGNVLLWERDGVTLRLESSLSKDESLTIAESVRAPN